MNRRENGGCTAVAATAPLQANPSDARAPPSPLVLSAVALAGCSAATYSFVSAGGLAWFAMAFAAALAVKQIGGLGPTLLMAIGAAIFAVGHPFPPGPIGIALFGPGVAWLELRREAAKAPEVQPVPAP